MAGRPFALVFAAGFAFVLAFVLALALLAFFVFLFFFVLILASPSGLCGRRAARPSGIAFRKSMER
jgi:hypothetical protein